MNENAGEEKVAWEYFQPTSTLVEQFFQVLSDFLCPALSFPIKTTSSVSNQWLTLQMRCWARNWWHQGSSSFEGDDTSNVTQGNMNFNQGTSSGLLPCAPAPPSQESLLALWSRWGGFEERVYIPPAVNILLVDRSTPKCLFFFC